VIGVLDNGANLKREETGVIKLCAGKSKNQEKVKMVNKFFY